MKKISKGYFRKGKYSISLISMHKEDSHPVYHSRYNILPWKALRVVNGMPEQLLFFNKSYIVEVEGMTRVAPTSITKYDFDLKKCHNFIDNEIMNIRADIGLLKSLGWEPKISLDIGLKLTIDGLS
ncbi:hypothetical protein HOL24_06170 [bacterium]|nr:hypothetical protein [bacterium]